MSKLGLLTLFSAISVTAGDSCGFPGVPAHAKYTTTDDRFSEGTTVTYECDPGYQLLGHSMLRCVGIDWDAPGIPFCAREIAFFKPSGMSSRNENAHLAVDDQSSTCASTISATKHEWWLDLIETTTVQIIQVHFGVALKNVDINITLEDPHSNSTSYCYRGLLSVEAATTEYFVCRETFPGKNLTISIASENRFTLGICEVKVYSQNVLSPEDSCGIGARGKVETFKGHCYEVTPLKASLEDAEKFCVSQESSLWSGDQTEFVSWMMKVHSLDEVWLQDKELSPNRDAKNCTLFSQDSAGQNRRNATCAETRFGLCVRPPKSCGRPRLPKNLASRDFFDKVPIGEVLSNFSCEEGLVLSGPKTYQCLEDGQFREQHPTACHRSTCGQPPEVSNAFPSLMPETRYYCLNDSFTLYGSPILKCDPETLRWETPHAICVRLSSDSRNGVKNFRDRLLQGASLFPVATKLGAVAFLILVVALGFFAIVAITNLVRYYHFIKPRLYQKHNSSVMLYTIHDELARDNPPAPGFNDQNHNNLVVNLNQELDLSTGDAQVVTRSTGSSTPNAPRTPNMRLNESSITETKMN